MKINTNTGSDYHSMVAIEQGQQWRQTPRNVIAQDTQGQVKEKETSTDAEKPLTRGEVQSVINSLVSTIKAMVTALENKFVTRSDVQNIAGNILQDLGRSIYITRQDALIIANNAVPASLRGLDNDARRKCGDTLKLASSPNGDSAYWGVVGGGGTNLPDGAASTPHLVWSTTEDEWEAGAILPTSATQHQLLSWNGSAWVADWGRWA